MNIRDVGRAIRDKHNYYLTPEYWSRMAKLCDRYGAESVFNALETMRDNSENLDHLLNCAEKMCQKVTTNDLSNITDDIFGE